MVRFYQSVDLRSRRDMIKFLQNHFRYYIMNSWNISQSYACNLKIYQLGLDSEIVDKLFDLIETQEFFYVMNDLMDEFNRDHDYRWQVSMNGKSGGYLVLYQGECHPSEHKSYCTQCGQRNFTSISDTGNICGRCRQASRVDYITPPLEVSVYPGRGTDDDEDFTDWDIEQLRDRVKLVQDLDRLADAMVQQAVDLTKNYEVQVEEYFVPQSRKVLKAL